MNQRLEKITSLLAKNKYDALIVTDDFNVSYLSGFDMGDAALLVMPEKPSLIITDPRFIQEISSVQGFAKEITSKGILKILLNEFKKHNLKKVAIESDSLTYRQYLSLKEACPDIDFISTVGLIERLRAVKEASEIDKIKKATQISISAFEALFDELKPGLSEKAIADRLEFLIRQNGASKAAFDIIVASADNSSRPHAIPAQRIFKPGEPLLIDWGAYFGGYNCDLTRVVFLDRIATDKKKIYKILLDAQDIAFNSIKPGVEAGEIDALVRNFLKDNKLEENMLHSLGHGIGLEVHELPRLTANNKTQLEENMVITVEPAVYFMSEIGMRIEDIVVITKDGCEVISKDLNREFYD